MHPTQFQIWFFQLTQESVIEFLAGVIALSTIFVLWKYNKSPEVRYLIYIELLAAVWAFAYGFEFCAPTLEAKIRWSQISYFGIAFLPVSYYFFTTAFSQKFHQINPRNIALLLILPIITLVLVFTNDMHRLVWREVYLDPDNGLLRYQHGTWFWLFWIYSFVLIFWGIFNLFHSIRKFTAYYRSQVSTLLIATFIPLTGNLMYITGINPIPGFDWTPALFVFTGLVVTFGIVRYRMFNLVPFARNKLIETMDDGMLVVNSEGFIEDCNAAVFQIFGLEKRKLIRRSFPVIFSRFPALTSAIEKEGANTIDLKVPGKEGTKFYHCHISPVYDYKNRFSGHFIQIQDVSSMKEAEQELKESNRQLLAEIDKRGRLIEDLDSFSHTVAHNLKNTLGSIYSSIEILEEMLDTGDASFIKELTGMIRESAGKAIHITRELLILATVSHQEIELGPVDMAAAFSGAQKRLKPTIEEFRADIKIPEEWPEVLGHAPWIEEVWFNYLSNAIKYGGSPPAIEAGFTRNNDHHVSFWIKDNGEGIPHEQHHKLFRKYARLQPEKADGYGLGLSIVKRIIDKLGGTVGIENNGSPEKGSLFYFNLPEAVTPE